MIYYAGIGSRETPKDVLKLMVRLGAELGEAGLTLRSGAASGADAAFEQGARSVGGRCHIWLPWPKFENHTSQLLPTPWHFTKAAQIHPAFHALSRGAKALHARNIGQVRGRGPSSCLSSFVICYTLDGCVSEASSTRSTGGTRTGIVQASRLRIPVFNLSIAAAHNNLRAYLRELLA